MAIVRPEVQALKHRLNRLWLFSPERLWRLSIALERRGHWALAFAVKQLNTVLYHNSLAPGATVGDNVHLGHNSIGIVVTANVEIGRDVKIWHNVTLSAGRTARARAAAADPERTERVAASNGHAAHAATAVPGGKPKIILEDGVTIGAGAIVIGPRDRTLRIGRGARVGAGTVVTRDVPAGARIVGAPARVLHEDGSEETEPERTGP